MDEETRARAIELGRARQERAVGDIEAHASMTRTDEADLSACSDGSLLHMRATYAAETAWAPPYAMAELRQVRAAALDMHAAVARSEAEAKVARADGDQERARRHEALARSARAAVTFYAEREDLDERLAADRTSWERLTAGSRRLALLADAELRRRHPGSRLALLVSAEPDALPDTVPAITDADTAMQHVAEVAARRSLFIQALERRLQMRIPSGNPDLEDDGEAWPVPAPADRAAILQPPKATLTPSQHILWQLDGELERER